MATVTKDLGLVTAYGYAKSQGYAGTEDEFAQICYDLTQTGGRLDEAEADIDDLKETVDDVAPIIVNTSPTASVLALTDGAEDKAVKRLTLNLLPHQAGSGVPSPSNVRAISGYNAIDVVRTGKNLVPNLDSPQTVRGVTYTQLADGGIRVQGVSSGQTPVYFWMSSDDVLKPNTYVISAKGGLSSTGVRFTIAIYRAGGGTSYYEVTQDGYQATFTINEGDTTACYMRTNGGDVSIDAVVYVMIRLASISDPTYEPYQSDTYPITLPQTVYGGELDVVSGKLKVTHGYTVFDGSDDEDWAQSGDNRMLTSISGSYAEGYTRIAVTANRGVFGTGSAVGTTFLSNQSLYYYQPTDITTASAFRSWLASNNLQVVYPLATPTEITLDPTTIKTLLGTNTIWMSADGTLQADYCADTKMYIDALTAPDDDMIANANIANGKYFTVNNKLYISTSAIAQGEQIVVGTNCNQTDLATALNALNA